MSERTAEQERLRFEGDLDKWMKIIGAGITGNQPEAYAVMDWACEQLVSLRKLIEWQPIETAPKTDEKAVHYILITDGVCLPSIVSWRPRRESYTDRSGNLRLPCPEGWFEAEGIRSRLCGKATHWMPLPALPSPAKQAEE